MRLNPADTLLARLRLGVLLVASGLSSAALAQPAAAEATVTVSGFTLTGNTLLDATTMAGVLGRYKGQRSFAELREAAQTVQALYAQAGYGAVVAYLPPQTVADGNVTIAIVEGKVSKVTVQGAQRLSPERVRRALPTLTEGQTPRVRRIDSELQIANENPGRQMGVLLGPGAQAGEVEATVKVEEAPLNRFNLGLDDTGNDRTGRYRVNAGWQYADLTGHDDVLSLQLQASPTETSAVKVLSAGYRLPLPGWLAALDLYAAYSDVDGGSTASAAGDIRFAGKGRIAGARGTAYLPRLGEFDQRLLIGLEHRAYVNDCAISGLPAGACGPAGESVTLRPLSLDYAAQRGGALSASFNVGVTHNLGLGGARASAAAFEAVRPGAERGYTLVRAGASLTLPVLEDWSVSGRIALQYTGNALVPGEQFGLGGANSVRGYEEREVAADRGLLASAEIVSPKLGWAAGPQTDLRLLAFVDAGQATQSDGAPCTGTRTRCSLASAGFGARLLLGPVAARLFVAQALKDGASTARRDWRSHFSVNASF